MNDSILLKRCRCGEEEAFDALIRKYYPYVRGFLIKNTHDPDLSQDLTQETFLKMIRSIEKFDETKDSSFGTWLIRIARNTYIDWLRRNRAVLVDVEELALSDGSDLHKDILRKMQYEDVLEAIKELPEAQRDVLLLRYNEEMTLQEIAALVHTEEKTVKSRLHDGLVKLRKRFKGEEQYG